MESFSTVRDTRRGSQSYMEKRRGSSEIKVTRIRGGIKRGESKLASKQLPSVLSTVWTPKRGSRSYTEKRRGRKETEVTRRRKGSIKRRETDPASNQFSECSPQPRTHKEIHRVGYRRERWGRRYWWPPFEDNELPFWMLDVLCQHSEVVLWNLFSVHMFFQWICRGESGIPILFLHHLNSSSQINFLK